MSDKKIKKCPETTRKACIPYQSKALNLSWIKTYCEKDCMECSIRKDIHDKIELSGGYPGEDE